MIYQEKKIEILPDEFNVYFSYSFESASVLKKNKKCTYLEDEVLEDEIRFEESIIKDDEHRNIHREIKKLPKDYATVLYLIYFEDLSYDEISKIMKKNNKQIKNLAYRARLALKETLGKEGFSYEE